MMALSVESWTTLFILCSFLLYLYIGWASRVKDAKGFFIASRGVPTIANGLATAGDWISAASFISMSGLVAALGHDGSIYLMGWTGGYVLVALLIAPYLRKFGQYTIPDFIGTRYNSNTARVLAVVAAIFISLTYIAGQMRGVGIVFSRFLQVDVNTGVLVGMVIIGFFAVVGGMKGITWTQIIQYGVLIVAFLIPAVALSLQLTGNPIPPLAFITSDIAVKLNQIQTDLGLTAYTEPFAHRTQVDVLTTVLALMLGTAGLPHILVRFYTVSNVRAARYSAAWAVLFIAILYTTAPAVATFARYNLIQSFDNQPIESIEQLSWTDKWVRTELLLLNDKSGDGRLQFTADPATNEIEIDSDIIFLSAPEISQLSPWVTGLVAAGGLAAALSTASGLLLVISSSIAHDIYFRIINPSATESQRINMGRGMVGLGLVIATYFGIHPPGFVGQVVAFAFGLAAASFFPLIVLGIFDRRANRQGAIAGMTVGLSFTSAYIIGARFYGMPLWVGGVSPEGIGTVGMLLNATVTWIVSRMTPRPPVSVQALISTLREPGKEPPRNVFLYRTLEEKLELRNAQLDQAYQDIKTLNQRLQTENSRLGMLNHQLQTEISERQQAEVALQQAQYETEAKNIRLEETLITLQETQTQLIQTEKMSSLGQLVAGVAHEINNPVSFIYGNVGHAIDYIQDLLELIGLYQNHYPHPETAIRTKKDEIDLDFLLEDLPKLLSSMKVGAERIQQIVLSLRTFSRMDEAEMKAVDIHTGIDSTLLILGNRFKATSKRPEILIVRDYSELPLVECYASQLNQVLMNLLANAVDALDEAVQKGLLIEAAQIRITTDLIQQTWIRISIADNGPGISSAIQEKLFDPFFTTKPVGKGTGLGLSISYKIVAETHCGKMWCESGPEIGTTFHIEIPQKIPKLSNADAQEA